MKKISLQQFLIYPPKFLGLGKNHPNRRKVTRCSRRAYPSPARFLSCRHHFCVPSCFAPSHVAVQRRFPSPASTLMEDIAVAGGTKVIDAIRATRAASLNLGDVYARYERSRRTCATSEMASSVENAPSPAEATRRSPPPAGGAVGRPAEFARGLPTPPLPSSRGQRSSRRRGECRD